MRGQGTVRCDYDKKALVRPAGMSSRKRRTMEFSDADAVNFSEKIDELKESFFHLAYSILNNADDAEEAVAEAIFRMWRSRDSLRNQDRM